MKSRRRNDLLGYDRWEGRQGVLHFNVTAVGSRVDNPGQVANDVVGKP